MIDSLKKNKKGIFLMLLSSICVCIGQLLWKMSNTNGLGFLLVGFVFYGLGALIMIIAYKFGSLSVLQPMLSFNYIFSVFLAKTVLNEKITLMKVIGVIIVMIGVLLIGGGDD